MSADFAILLAPSAWSHLGQVDAASYEQISRELKELAARAPDGGPVKADIQIAGFLIAYEVEPAHHRLVVHAVRRAP